MFKSFKDYHICMVACVTFLILSLFIYPYPCYFEDSFISYRYIASLSDGNFFAWNFDGKPTYGMTGLLFPCLAAFLNVFLHDPIQSASVVGLLFSVVSVFIFTRYAVRKSLFGVIAGLLFLLSPTLMRGSTNGLETSLVIFSCVGLVCGRGVLFKCSSQGKTLSILSTITALAYLVRPDLIVFFLSYVTFVFFLEKKSYTLIGLYLLISSFQISVIVIACNYIFGSPLPLSWIIKTDIVGVITYPSWVLSQHVFFVVSENSILLALAGLGVFLMPSSEYRDFVPVLFATLLFWIYSLTILPIMNNGLRFSSPILVGLSTLAISGCDILDSIVKTRRHVFVSFSLLYVTIVFAAPTVTARKSAISDAIIDHSQFEEIGRRLSTITGIHIASPEDGKLAYYSKAKFFDLTGLNQSFVAYKNRSEMYSEQLSELLSKDMIDVYVGLSKGVGAEYIHLEDMLKDFSTKYDCDRTVKMRDGKVFDGIICIRRESKFFDAIAKVLEMKTP